MDIIKEKFHIDFVSAISINNTLQLTIQHHCQWEQNLLYGFQFLQVQHISGIRIGQIGIEEHIGKSGVFIISPANGISSTLNSSRG